MTNIHLELSGGSVYATSVVLWNFTGSIEEGFIGLKVYLSDGSSTTVMRYSEYEMTASRKPIGGDIEAGYYRFSVVTCWYNEEFITFPEVWTEWYYLTADTRYYNGVLLGTE